MLVEVWRKKTCFIQFSLKNKALNFRSDFLARTLHRKKKQLNFQFFSTLSKKGRGEEGEWGRKCLTDLI